MVISIIVVPGVYVVFSLSLSISFHCYLLSGSAKRFRCTNSGGIANWSTTFLGVVPLLTVCRIEADVAWSLGTGRDMPVRSGIRAWSARCEVFEAWSDKAEDLG